MSQRSSEGRGHSQLSPASPQSSGPGSALSLAAAVPDTPVGPHPRTARTEASLQSRQTGPDSWKTLIKGEAWLVYTLQLDLDRGFQDAYFWLDL